MKKAFVFSMLLVFACSALAFAQETKSPEDLPIPDGGSVPCATADYKQFTVNANLTIPDNIAAGVSSSLTLTETGTIEDVIVSVSANHSWVGDLVASLSLDSNCDGVVDAGPVRFLCRQNRTTGCFGTSGFGCSGNLVSTNAYEWSDAVAAEMGEPTCPSTIASGCYKPSAEGGLLAAFDGLDKSGCWILNVSDNAGGDTGNVVSWTLSIKNAAPQTVACCFFDGTCADLLADECAAAGGTAGGPGSACATTVCPDQRPRGACCYADGSCADGVLVSDCTGTAYPGQTCSQISCVNATESKSWGEVKGLYR
ncbi:MAG: hypothetical protein ACKVU1_10780 [bacterium]